MRRHQAAVLATALGVVLSACGPAGSDGVPADPRVGELVTPAIDARSYRLGGIGAFAEMVGAGVKKLALSAALDPVEMDALVDDATRIAHENGAEIYRETDFLVTDLFPAETTDGKHVLLISSAQTRREYMELKAEKARLVERGEYEGELRRRIARSFGGLLSYSDEKIEALLEAGGGGS